MQVSILIYTMGREAEHLFKSFTLADGEDVKFAVILAKFDELTRGHIFTKGSKIKEKQSNHSYRVFMNWPNAVTVVISKYGRSIPCSYGLLWPMENTNVPESSNTSPDTGYQNAIPEQRTSSGRLVGKPIRYREDI